MDDVVVASDEENGGEIYLLHDVLASPNEDVASRAARRLDWSEFLAGLSKREQAVITCLIEGRPLAGLARRRHLNLSTMMYHKERCGGPGFLVGVEG
jgi:DNA-binding NarL/FixJ family response regulator